MSSKFWVYHNKHGAYQLTGKLSAHRGLLGLLHPLVAKKKIMLLKIFVWSRWQFGRVYMDHP